MAGGTIPANLAPIFQAAGRANNIPASVLAGVSSVESNLFRNTGPSSAGAVGGMQFEPATARALGINPNDPRQAIFGAAKLLNQYGYQKNPTRALGAYNGGPGNPQYSYAQQVLAEAKRLAPQFQGSQAASALPTSPQMPSQPMGVQSTTVPTFNQAAYNKANARYIAGSFLSGQHNPFDIGPKGADLGPNPVFSQGGLTTTAPNAADYQGTKVIQAAQAGLQKLAGGTQLHAHPAITAAATSSLPKGITQFDGKPVAAWIAPVLAYAQKHGWQGSVTSGYRTLAQQTQIYNSGVRPAAKPGTSNHEMTAFPGGAVDVSNAQQLSQILAKSPYASLLVYAGPKDAVHFSHPHNGGY